MAPHVVMNHNEGRVPRRRIALVALALACVTAALAFAPGLALAKSYSIDKVDIDATVAADGTITVVEDRTFNFDGSFHGVYWDIPVGTFNGRAVTADVTSMGEVANGSFSAFSQSASEASGTYTVRGTTTDSGSSVEEAKIYSTKDDESATYRITYVLTGVTSSWADTGELYWKFVSDGWEEGSSNITCTIHLPVAAGQTVTAGDNVRAWGHGSLDGEVSFSGNDVVFTMPSVSSSEYAEAHITFPNSWLTGMTPSTTSKLDSILSEEQQWADEANAQRNQARVVMYGVIAAVLVLAVLSLLNTLRVRRNYKRTHTPQFQGEYFRDVPSADHPAVLGYLYNGGSVEAKEFTATLMHLSDEGALGLDLVKTTRKSILGDKEDKDYRMVEAKDASELSDPIDREAMGFLFGVLSRYSTSSEPDEKGRATLLFSSIKGAAKKHPEEYSDGYDSWKSQVEAISEARGLMTDKNSVGKGLAIGLSVLDVILGVLAFMFLLMAADGFSVLVLFSVVLLGVGAFGIVSCSHMDSLSAEGVEIKAKMVALRKWLLEFTRLKEAVPSDVVLWNKLLVLAVTLDVADEVIDQLKVAMPELLEDPDFMYTYYWYAGYGAYGRPFVLLTGAVDDATHVSMAALAASSDSSGGGFGGGFSGGGGGGFGGGGGGGAF
jgi:uncharacterized membrane protein